MPVTMEATVKLGTDELRAALVAVLPHAKRTKKDEDVIMHRVRCVFGNGKALVMATQGQTTGLARLDYIDDTRGDLWDPEDGPMVVDLWPENVRLLKQWMAAKAVGDDEDKVTAITVNRKIGEVEFEMIGTTNAGERHAFNLHHPADLFPDVADITKQALMGAAGESLPARTLVQDGKLIGLFNAAATQYKQPLRWRATGTRDTAKGFVVECGPSFVGTISSDPGGDEGVRRHSRWSQDMIAGLSVDLSANPVEPAEDADPGRTLVSV
jgi:hypothetical protein